MLPSVYAIQKTGMGLLIFLSYVRNLAMKHRFLITLLVGMMTSSVQANEDWMFVGWMGATGNEGFQMQIDLKSIKINQFKVSHRLGKSYQTPKTAPNGKSYTFMMMQVVQDCAHKTYRIQSARYLNNQQEIIHQETYGKGPFIPLIANSPLEGVHKSACIYVLPPAPDDDVPG
jgi:hypothetical protein